MTEPILSNILQETERRFQEREKERKKIQRKIDQGAILEANDPQHIEQRMKSLNLDTEKLPIEEMAQGNELIVPLENLSGPEKLEAVGLERILGNNDLMSVNYLALGLQRARSVGRIRVRNKQGQTLGYGTGFLVSPRLILTNNHVLANAAQAQHSQIEFDYEVQLNGNLKLATSLPLAPDQFFLTDADLDFTLVALKPGASGEPDLTRYGWCRLREEEGLVLKGEYVSIIQHPNGEPKQIAMRENRVLDLLENFLHYHTDTAPGSSGSPVFNDQWEIVSLHHSGVPKRDEQGRVLATDGRLWQKLMGEHRIQWIANEGVHVYQILRFLKKANLKTEWKPLRKDLLEKELPELDEVEGAISVKPQPRPEPDRLAKPEPEPIRSAKPAQQTVVTAIGSAEVTIPLTITVQLGKPDST